MSTRFPFWRLSTSTLSECRTAFTTTVLFKDGFTEIEPYGFITDTPAFGPTAKWYSFLLSATSVPATIAPIATSLAARLLTIKPLPQTLSKTFTLWQRTVHRHFKKHGFLVVRIHQRPPGFLVIRTLIHQPLGLTDGVIHLAQVLCILRLHRGSVVRHFLHQFVVIQVRGVRHRHSHRSLLGQPSGHRRSSHVDSHGQQQHRRRRHQPSCRSPARAERGHRRPHCLL